MKVYRELVSAKEAAILSEQINTNLIAQITAFNKLIIDTANKGLRSVTIVNLSHEMQEELELSGYRIGRVPFTENKFNISW